ncbi:type II secretion system F family protein [Ornithinimicrobium murale]|uniref:type II secretion system F family protein n=1 Tax=Ornithinimicrobium murale TaxID=1050153 RepID=UPI000E0D9141|nr:type II secretion system F family protein [Ornithinimicrobium murale]
MSVPMALWALVGLLVSSGLVLIYVGTQPPPPPSGPRPPSPTWTRIKARLPRLSRTERAVLVITSAAGLAVAVLTPWTTALFALPLAAIMIPRMFVGGGEDKVRTERLVALEEWARGLAGLLGTRARLNDALVGTLRSTPEAIREPVSKLVARLQANRPADEALQAFADDLDDPTGDLVASALILGSRQSGAGLRRILEQLTNEVANEVRIRREIETSRAGGRTEAKWMMILAPLGMFVFLAFTTYGHFYASPFGQAILSLILVAFFGCLVWMHAVTVTKPEPRFLVRATESRS